MTNLKLNFKFVAFAIYGLSYKLLPYASEIQDTITRLIVLLSAIIQDLCG